MLPTFQNALLRRSCRIAGVHLPPVTLARLYCLHAWESPLVQGGALTVGEFGLALWTLRHPCWPLDRFGRDVCAGKPDREVARIGRRYGRRFSPKRFAADVTALRAFVDWHAAVPERFTKGPKRPGSSAPWPMVIAMQLAPAVGEKRAWTMPAPLALACKIAIDNSAGDTSWKSETEQGQGYANGGNTQSD